MAGHIKLGKLADTTLRDYVLEDIHGQHVETASPFVARISSSGPYTELDTYSEFAVQNFSNGVGHKNPEEGQYFSLGDTRYPGYMVGAPVWDYPLSVENQSPAGTTAKNATIFSGTLYASSFVATQTASIYGVWVYVSLPPSQLATVSLWSDDGAGKPLASLKSKTVVPEMERPHLHWVRFTFTSAQAVTSGTRYHVVVTTGQAAVDYLNNSPYVGKRGIGTEKYHTSIDSGTTWVYVSTTGIQYLIIYGNTGVGAREIIKGIYTYNSSVYVWHDNTLSKLVAGALVAQLSPASIISCVQYGDYIYVSAYTDYYRFSTVTDTYSTFTTDASRFLAHGGYLWRCTDSTISYTADTNEVIWTSVGGVMVGGTFDSIKGIAGLGDNVYFATGSGLYMVAAGDFIVQIATWANIHADNGKNMVAWEGALYIPLQGGAIMRYDSSGAMINVGINANGQMPDSLKGNVLHLYPSNYFLYAVVGAELGTTLYPSLWSYNVDGWHCLSIGPQGEDWGGSVGIDRVNGFLYWGISGLILHRTPYYSSVNNPVYDMIRTEYVAEGWVEYEKFFAGHVALDKDFDRVFIDHAGILSFGSYYVYFKSSYNSDGDWIYAGVLTDDGGTFLFPPTFRPKGKWIKIAIRFERFGTSPVIQKPLMLGFSLKYAVNVADRWRWVLPILISNNQEFPDGSVNAYTAVQQKAHIEELITEIAPLKFVDLLGTSFLVKVTSARCDVLRYDWNKGTNTPATQLVYTLQVEECSPPEGGIIWI